MNYYSIKFNIVEDKEIIKSETVGIQSAERLTAESAHSALLKFIKLAQNLSLEVTDKIDIGEPDFLRLDKRYV